MWRPLRRYYASGIDSEIRVVKALRTKAQGAGLPQGPISSILLGHSIEYLYLTGKQIKGQSD